MWGCLTVLIRRVHTLHESFVPFQRRLETALRAGDSFPLLAGGICYVFVAVVCSAVCCEPGLEAAGFVEVVHPVRGVRSVEEGVEGI